ncbi:inositol monophosphatase [Acrocarpospora phusangensis]|uniref:Inositol monophosphatase n=1 Tax=Acrocarpospora phusangensis TaxID=1070424 RepID=A0A919QAN6_9ACTN|nr:inositol monophosphatase [Acrocarpospora phusangensis]GIH25664.1 inositol monophosphatase [Acrocarpospora phusangensis]
MRRETVDLQQARYVAIDAAESAGSLLRGRSDRHFDVWAKSEGDLVTELDLAAERLIVDRIRARYPHHQIVSEEAGTLSGDVRWNWLVDPLDGTNNIAMGLNVYTVGITLCLRGLPVVAAVHEPGSGHTWSAVRHQGAFAGRDRPLVRRERPPRSRPTLAWNQGYRVTPEDPTATALRLVLDRESTRVLRLWAPLLSWVMLARGDLDGIVGYEIGELDLHAGALIATEAGLRVTDPSGRAFDPRVGTLTEDRSLVAGTGEAVPWLLELWSAAEKLSSRVPDLWDS